MKMKGLKQESTSLINTYRVSKGYTLYGRGSEQVTKHLFKLPYYVMLKDIYAHMIFLIPFILKIV